MADDFRRFPGSETRQIIDYNRFMSLTGEKVFICLDRGIMEIARYFLNSRGSWRTTYVKEYVGTIGYNMPTEAEFQNVLQAIAEANIDMSTCDDIVNAINGVRDAISSGGGGSGGCGCVGDGGTDVTDVNDTPSEEIPPSSDWEEAGFSSQEAYDNHRCNAAQYILQNYLQTLRNWAGLFGTVGGLTLAVITGLLLLTVPPAGLMLILAAMGVLVGVDIGLLTNLASIATDLEDDIDTLRCQLYNATDTGSAVSILQDAAQAAVEALSLGLLEPTFIAITDNLISNEQMAILFDPGASTGDVTSADCSTCPGAFWYSCYQGTWDPASETNHSVEIQAGVIETGVYLMAYGVDDTHPGTYTFTVVDGSVTPPATVPEFCYAVRDNSLDYEDFCGAGNGTTWWTSLESGFAGSDTWDSSFVFQIRSGTPFTMLIEWAP